jgi:hypothetical protein
MIDGYWISTIILIAMTCGVVYFRATAQSTDSNWPLVYYVFTVLHLQLNPEGLSQSVVLSAIIAAMLIRFEFMSGWFLKMVQMAEFICLGLIAYSLFLIAF